MADNLDETQTTPEQGETQNQYTNEEPKTKYESQSITTEGKAQGELETFEGIKEDNKDEFKESKEGDEEVERNEIKEEEPLEMETTEVEFIEMDENGEEIVIKKRVPLVSQTRKIVKRKVFKPVRVSQFLENEEEVEEEAEIIQDVFFEVIKKVVRVVMKNEAGEDEEKEVEMLEELMLPGQPKGTKVVFVSVPKDNGEMSEEELVVDIEGEEEGEEEEKVIKPGIIHKKYRKKYFKHAKMHPYLLGEEETEDEESEEESEISDEEGEEEEEEEEQEQEEEEKKLKVVVRKKKMKTIKNLFGRRKLRKYLLTNGNSPLETVEVPLEDKIDVAALLACDEEDDEMVEEEESVEVEEEEEEEDDPEVQKIHAELTETLQQLTYESLRHKRRNIILCKKLYEHFKITKSKKEEEDSDAEKMYEDKLKEYIEIRDYVLEQSREYIKELDKVEKERDEMRAEVIKEMSALEAKERQLAAKVEKTASRFLLKNETLDRLITKQFEMDKRVCEKRIEYLYYLDKLNELDLEEKGQLAVAAKEVNFIEYDKVQKDVQDLQDILYFKEVSILKSRNTLVSNAQRLAHIEQKKAAIDQHLQDVMKQQEEKPKTFFKTRARFQFMKEEQVRIEKEIKQLNNKVGLIKYPKLLRDYKYIGEKYDLVNRELNDVKTKYKTKCDLLKELVEKQKARRKPPTVKPVFKQ